MLPKAYRDLISSRPPVSDFVQYVARLDHKELTELREDMARLRFEWVCPHQGRVTQYFFFIKGKNLVHYFSH